MFSFLQKKGLRVLMYHKISESETDFLTVTTAQFDAQLGWVRAQGFQFVSMKNVLSWAKNGENLPEKPVLLTFDDAYTSQVELGAPILKKHGATATIFVPTQFLGRTNEWDNDRRKPILSAAELQNVDPDLFSFGLHTHAHVSFGNVDLATMQREIEENKAILNDQKIPFLPVFAYPFGSRPKKNPLRQQMFSMLSEQKIELGFRIGNRINGLKNNKNWLELERLDIRGDECFETFKRKIWFGKNFWD
jgi:peptidoglycan/xylan/chitin deacetylase (PgdA/CDA1 family)